MTSSQLDLLQQGEQEIDEVLEEEDEAVPFQYAISTTPRDYDVLSLVNRLKAGDIVIPQFQRGYVWSLKEASRFIESLLFGLPVPNIFLSVEPDTERLLVVDGRQRLSTLQYFYNGIWPLTKREFAVKGTGEKGKYESMTYASLTEADRRRLDNALLPAFIIKQDQPSEDNSSIYHVFERLNTSGVSLTPQEIRAAIYHGKFSDLLNEINKNTLWREIYGPENKFMRDEELLQRAELRNAHERVPEQVHGPESRSDEILWRYSERALQAVDSNNLQGSWQAGISSFKSYQHRCL